MQSHVMTANGLADGAVVYLHASGRWVRDLQQAVVADTAEGCAKLEALAEEAVRKRLVIGPYLFAVSLNESGPQPIVQRERIRAAGPTVGTDLPAGRQDAEV